MQDSMVLDLSNTSLSPTVPLTDDNVGPPITAVMSDGTWLPVSPAMWRSWTGRRALWGVEYHGPVYRAGSAEDSPPFDGKRSCPCSTCQTWVAPVHRFV